MRAETLVGWAIELPRRQAISEKERISFHIACGGQVVQTPLGQWKCLLWHRVKALGGIETTAGALSHLTRRITQIESSARLFVVDAGHIRSVNQSFAIRHSLQVAVESTGLSCDRCRFCRADICFRRRCAQCSCGPERMRNPARGRPDSFSGPLTDARLGFPEWPPED